MKAKPLDETLYRELRDPEFAAAYLQDALEDSAEEFLVALKKYVQANEGMARVAKAADVAREALYRMLSENGNPAFKSVDSIIRASGFRVQFVVTSTGPTEADDSLSAISRENCEPELIGISS